jgi:UDP-N-acetylmuramyl pentapeptide phosphotransferase/UDP-N-acetylglucosamine-1-phosphate transferase
MTTVTLPILLVLLFSSFVGSYLLFPKIIAIAQFKRLIASPNGRSSHLTQIPNIGGLVFFIALIFGLYLSNEWDTDDAALTLITGMMVLFFVGLKDDLMVISAKTKFFSQLGAILLILYNPAFQVQTLNGFLGIQEIPLWLGIPFSAFVMLSIINSFNFIDGIDGLAGFVAMIILGFFGILLN